MAHKGARVLQQLVHPQWISADKAIPLKILHVLLENRCHFVTALHSSIDANLDDADKGDSLAPVSEAGKIILEPLVFVARD